MFITHRFACNIQSSVVEGLGLCQLGSSPGECFARWIGLVRDLKRILQGFVSLFSLHNVQEIGRLQSSKSLSQSAIVFSDWITILHTDVSAKIIYYL